MFSKRHYEAIAQAMQRAKPDAPEPNNKEAQKRYAALLSQWHVVTGQLASAFERDNAAFNRTRFYAACEPGANVKARTRYKLPEGVTAIGLSDPKRLHDTIADAIGEQARRARIMEAEGH